MDSLLYVDVSTTGQITVDKQRCFPQEKLGDFKRSSVQKEQRLHTAGYKEGKARKAEKSLS